ncbi:PREDICTED: uncharacterized protein LOC106820509 [Priapulus caudatus]|uniref:Uncharacterized protein LOC106820509 n=1 Tax=Priapulus caudatus TaxID=37621 RepID=A0ABM1F7T6_PRICU|nr:PREDICTED: uncharacterized protein LOC106820509 [Priapulus caudatus]
MDVIPTKRNVVKLASTFYDPLGIVAPAILRFKMLFQELCQMKSRWDDLLENSLLVKWNNLVQDLQRAASITIPRCYYPMSLHQNCELVYKIHGFCDASAKAYGAVIYLVVMSHSTRTIRFLVSKTSQRVTPVSGMTIPRLELLSALVLARLIRTVKEALKFEITIDETYCWSDSRVALAWIKGVKSEWKQFVQNRVNEVRKLVPVDTWGHCPGSMNPADIASRGMALEELSQCSTWIDGPYWLKQSDTPDNPDVLPEEDDLSQMDLPIECLDEMKVKAKRELVMLTTEHEFPARIGTIMDITDFSTRRSRLRVTAHVC